MANLNPWKARLARALKRKPGDIDALRRCTWGLLCQAYDDCGVAGPEERRKATLAYAQLAGVYVKLCEAGEYEARITALEEQAIALSKAQQSR